jgi:hypothetical protein
MEMRTLLKGFGVLVLSCTFLGIGSAQTMTEVMFPQYFGGKNGATTNTLRMNTAFYITLGGLVASTGYRLTAGMVNSTDGTTSNGAGIFFVPGVTAATINAGTLTSSTELVTTDVSGNVTFWIAILTSGNARFEPGTAAANLLSLRIGLNDGAGGLAVVTRITSTSTLIPLDLSTVARTAGTDDDGAFIQGASLSQAGKFVMIWDNTAGTGRPLHGYVIEDNGITESSTPTFYSSSVAGVTGAYGLIMPSNNPNGVQRIEALNADGSILDFSTDADGIWPLGSNTVNPARGSIVPITPVDAPLPIALSSFSANMMSGNGVSIKWTTISEISNYGFEVERAGQSSGPFEKISALIAGHGTTNVTQHYSFVDNSPLNGVGYYRLKQIDLDRSIHYSEAIAVQKESAPVENAPNQFALYQNYPNPFNPATEIRFSVETTGNATLRLYNAIGQEVSTLFNGVAEVGHYYTVKIDGSGLASGVYFSRLESNGRWDMKKLILMK